MRKDHFQMGKKFRIICLCLVLCTLTASLGACANDGKTMMTLEDKSLGVNTYEFLLSRMKGTLAYYGYDVTDESFWNTIVSSDGTTYDEYFCATIRQEAAKYLIAEYLFDKEGLVFSKDDEKKIDGVMKKLVTAAGSKTALNNELKSFHVNYSMLREIYILEAKLLMLQEHLYGENGNKIEKDDKEKYLDENYVCFKQIFLATYDYKIDTDRFGDNVYYVDDKKKAIAYDKENGVTVTDEFGKTVKDLFGDPEYYTEDGKIAYDKKNGVLGYLTDSKGNKVIENFSEKQKAEIYNTATKYAESCNGDEAAFDEHSELYNETDSTGKMYLYSSVGYYAAQNDSVAYFDDIAEMLADMKTGECRVYNSDFGCHVLFKCENEDGAYALEENKDAFADFNDNLIAYLFDALCREYEGSIVFDESVAAEAATMKEIGANTLY